MHTYLKIIEFEYVVNFEQFLVATSWVLALKETQAPPLVQLLFVGFLHRS